MARGEKLTNDHSQVQSQLGSLCKAGSNSHLCKCEVGRVESDSVCRCCLSSRQLHSRMVTFNVPVIHLKPTTLRSNFWVSPSDFQSAILCVAAAQYNSAVVRIVKNFIILHGFQGQLHAIAVRQFDLAFYAGAFWNFFVTSLFACNVSKEISPLTLLF